MTFPVRARALAVLAAGLSAAVAAPRPAPAADTYSADAVHSSIVFRVKHMNTTFFWGRFNDLGGTFTLDPADPSQTKLQFQVKTASVDTANAKRDQHVKSLDFFNVVEFPTASFTSKSATKAGEGYDVVGDLTLHGVTKPVTVRVTPTGSGRGPTGASIAGIEATFSIKRSDFGMSNMVGPLGDDVWVSVCVEGIKK
jgi:polyisoprenoid-binding protein YceI